MTISRKCFANLAKSCAILAAGAQDSTASLSSFARQTPRSPARMAHHQLVKHRIACVRSPAFAFFFAKVAQASLPIMLIRAKPPRAMDLRSPTFLKDLDPGQLEILSKIATKRRFKAGQKILRQRDTADGFYLIEEGLVSLDYELPHKRCIQIQQLGPGELLGWSWLAEPYQWQFSATAVEDVSASFFRVSDLREQCARNPKLGYALMERIARVLMERLQATRHKLLIFTQRASGEDAQIC